MTALPIPIVSLTSTTETADLEDICEKAAYGSPGELIRLLTSSDATYTFKGQTHRQKTAWRQKEGYFRREENGRIEYLFLDKDVSGNTGTFYYNFSREQAEHVDKTLESLTQLRQPRTINRYEAYGAVVGFSLGALALGYNILSSLRNELNPDNISISIVGMGSATILGYAFGKGTQLAEVEKHKETAKIHINKVTALKLTDADTNSYCPYVIATALGVRQL